MILPTKHINPLDSLLGIGALILERLKNDKNSDANFGMRCGNCRRL